MERRSQRVVGCSRSVVRAAALAVVVMTARPGLASLIFAPPGQDDENGDQQKGPVEPATPIRAKPADPPAVPALLPPDERADLQAQYNRATPAERERMKAYYAALGRDLDAMLGLSQEAAKSAARLAQIVAGLEKIPHTERDILESRITLASAKVEPQPDPARGEPKAIAAWITLRVSARAWGELGEYLKQFTPTDSAGILSTVYRALAADGPGELRSTDVIALANSAPAAPSVDHLAQLAALLKKSNDDGNPKDLMASLAAEPGYFGPADETRRARSLELLTKAERYRDAYTFLSPLDQARAEHDPAKILAHAQYLRQSTEKMIEGAEYETRCRETWGLFREVSLMPAVDASVRGEAIERALTLSHRVPRVMAEEWLQELFADPRTRDVAFQRLHSTVRRLGTEENSPSDRASLAQTVRRGVDQFVRNTRNDRSGREQPLRALTLVLIDQFEKRLTAIRKAMQDYYPYDDIPTYLTDELRAMVAAMPDGEWLDALDTATAVRACTTGMALAMPVDDLDRAVTLLEHLSTRGREACVAPADRLLEIWSQHGNVGRYGRSSSVVTRGQQQRQMLLLRRVMEAVKRAEGNPENLRHLAATFKVCHSGSEVFSRGEVETVFGPVDELPASTSRALAESMQGALRGLWRERLATPANAQAAAAPGAPGSYTSAPNSPAAAGTPLPSQADLVQQIEGGYALALALVDRALAAEPKSWKSAALRAGLVSDRGHFQAKLGTIDAPTRAALKRQVFEAFDRAARTYREGLLANTEIESVTAYVSWFNAAMGSSQLGMATFEDLPGEGSLEGEQLRLIAGELGKLPGATRDRHLEEFAKTMNEAFGKASPDVKPRLLSAAMEVIGEHAAGAGLRQRHEIYTDLAQREVKLRWVVDGPDTVRAGSPFGLRLMLRATNPADRENDSFRDYLRNGVEKDSSGTNKTFDFRDMLQRDIEQSLGAFFQVEAMAFFDPYAYTTMVTENGEAGWVERAMAYVVVTPRDASIDHIPRTTMDIWCADGQGSEVALVISSDSPAIAVSEHATTSAAESVEIHQTIDARGAGSGSGREGTITLEIRARARGAVPPLDDLLAGIGAAADGYTPEVKQNSYVVLTSSSHRYSSSSRSGLTYIGASGKTPDLRPTVERTWTVSYVPTGGARGDEFRIPALQAGLQGTSQSLTYADMDLVPVRGASIALEPRWWTPVRWIVIAAAAAGAVALASFAYLRRRRVQPAGPIVSFRPSVLTPVSVVMSLRRAAADPRAGLDPAACSSLGDVIARLEREYFGREAGTPDEASLRAVLDRWISEIPVVDGSPRIATTSRRA